MLGCCSGPIGRPQPFPRLRGVAREDNEGRAALGAERPGLEAGPAA